MNYQSTRSTHKTNASQAILQGLAPDKGLFVPETLPKLEPIRNKSYQEIAQIILELFFDFDSQTLQDAIQRAYNTTTFSHPQITNIRTLDAKMSLLELFYGPTCAFKDQALALYPYLLKAAMQENKVDHLTILTATSGDTGKAAMEALKDISGIDIIVLYPDKGTSPIQRTQMVTQEGANVFPIALAGNFDDCQRTVKHMFSKLTNLSSANSINIARLIPQIIYYYDAYARLDTQEAIDVSVPTGNFGNALAAYMAREMGLPIRKIIVSTNTNQVMHDFIQTGRYDLRQRTLVKTASPSMDILIASNLERLLYFMFNDTAKVKAWMEDLESKQYFALSKEELSHIQAVFQSQSKTDQETRETIEAVAKAHKLCLDPHSATAIPKNTSDSLTLVVSTASPFKFPTIYKEAFDLQGEDDFEILDELEALFPGTYPLALKSLRLKPIRHQRFATTNQIQNMIESIIRRHHEI